MACPLPRFIRFPSEILPWQILSWDYTIPLSVIIIIIMIVSFDSRAGKIQGQCASGYLCVSGSAEFTPQCPQSNWSHCEWGVQCAGPCPSGGLLSMMRFHLNGCNLHLPFSIEQLKKLRKHLTQETKQNNKTSALLRQDPVCHFTHTSARKALCTRHQCCSMRH